MQHIKKRISLFQQLLCILLIAFITQVAFGSNNVFYDAKIGWKITVPINWRITNSSQSAGKTKRGSYILLWYEKNNLNKFVSSYAVFDSPTDMKTFKYLNEIGRQSYENSLTKKGISYRKPQITNWLIDGKYFRVWKYELNNVKENTKYSQKIYMGMIGNKMVSFSMIYTNENDHQIMEKALMKSRFLK